MKEFLLYLSNVEIVLLGILLVSFMIQMVFYIGVYGKVLSRRKPEGTQANQPVSVIICARNEAENLEAHLPVILEQEYPDFEVVVVNDCSSDHSEHILKKYSETYPHLKVTTIKEDEKFVHGKKLAMTIGIKAAKNEWLLFTDADCIPENRQWIATMQQHFTEQNKVVLGYGGYKIQKSFLNKLIRFDTFFIALQYLGFARCKKPYMGVGRNLAYRKSLYNENRGFASHAHISSGDDDLFINEAAQGKSTAIECSLNAHTRSNPKMTYASWKFQKKRHMSTARYYKTSHKILLTLEPLFRVLFILSCIAFAILSPFWYIGAGLFVVRLLVQQIIFSKALKMLNEKHLLAISAFFDLILPLININIYTLNLFSTNKNKWK